MKLKYRRNGHRYAHDLTGEWEADDDLEEMAEAAAQDYWSNHDGFEARWPLTFDILLPDGGLIGSAVVEMDTEPAFTAKPHNVQLEPTPERAARRETKSAAFGRSARSVC